MSSEEQTLGALLSKLRNSANTSQDALPLPSAFHAPDNGISLFDTKSDLFLEYLQTLVFLLFTKLRARKNGPASHSVPSLEQEAVKKLVELRVYLERGARPLENRMKYQIDKILRAADTPSQSTQQNLASHSKKSLEQVSDEDQSEDPIDENVQPSNVEELAYRPSLAAFAPKASTKTKVQEGRRDDNHTGDSKYRPPRITPTALPTTDGVEKDSRKPSKTVRSAAVDDYIANELSTAPTAEPSIGSTITAGGRRTKTARERAREDERRDYEEANFTRLPRESNKERAREHARAAQRGGQMGEFDLSGLGAMSDRVARATAKRSGSKRGRDVADSPRGGGFDGGYKESRRRKN